MNNRARNGTKKPATGLGWFYGCPQASYSANDLAKIFADAWDVPCTLRHIRVAIRSGELHPFRNGTVNLFERREVSGFVERYHPSTPGERANAAICSGYRDLCIPAEALLRMLKAAAAGKWQPSPDLLFPDVRLAGDVVPGERTNDRYPAANVDSFTERSTQRHLSNAVPALRTRIRRSSGRDRQRDSTDGGFNGEHRHDS